MVGLVDFSVRVHVGIDRGPGEGRSGRRLAL
jgi:hypothetical protein